jgi:branched-chain amino acid aminotransferase group I
MSGSPALVHWNGQVLEAEAARVSVLDAGFLYGDGIYETLRVYDGRPFALDRHLERLAHSARGIRLSIPDAAVLRSAVTELLAAARLPSAVLRITITRGRLARRLDLSSAGSPSVLVTTDPLDPAGDRERENGIRVIYSGFLRHSDSPLAGVKSTNYQVSLFARNEAREAGAAEVLVPNESGDIVEAAAANVFLVEGRSIVTPPLGTGILGGITREVVIDLAGEHGYDVQEETLPRARIEAADEVFLTGTTIEVAPVTRIGERSIRDGRPGPVSRAMREAYRAAVAADIGDAESGLPSERIR